MEAIISQSEYLELAEPVKLALAMTLLGFIPFFLMAVTCFARFVIVFSLLRFALGLQQTPPNMMVITLSLFLTFYAMSDVFSEVANNAVKPFLNDEIQLLEAAERVKTPFSLFMFKQTRKEDLTLILELKQKPLPSSKEEVAFFELIPAFLLSELRTAFKIGFVIFVPFLLVDLVVSSVLMGLGMIMLPPITVALPIKIMLFVIIDGWALITQSLVSSVLT